jgi:flagellin
MGLSILSNIPSLEAQNQLATTNTNLQNTLFQLSSGSKINSGADDPAGLSIADGLQANISALTQSAQNVTDGVGMLQTADGALSQVTTLLNRAVTLATEAGNAGLTTDQQNALQNEYASITQEINQIGSNTTYNNNQVFTSQLTSVFLSDGSQTDAADPTISVTIPTLSATSLGLSSYATGTLDFTTNPQAGNTVTIGQQTYTFATTSTAAGEVTLGTGATALQTTLQNLQDAVNGTGTASAGTYGVGTAVNQSAQLLPANGGSITVQSLAAGAAGNDITLATNLTSNVGASGPTLTGAANATNNNATLTLNANPGTIHTATGSITMTDLPDTVQSATGIFNLDSTGTAAQPAVGNATGTLNFTAQKPANGDTVVVGGTTYTFMLQASMVANNNDVEIDTTAGAAGITNTLNNLAAAVNANSTGGGSATTYYLNSTTSLHQAYMTVAGGATVADVTAGFGVATAVGASDTTGAVVANTAASNYDSVTVGGQTYTFVAANTAYSTTAGANLVALGSNENGTLQNLAAAVNGGGTGGAIGTYSTTATAAGTAQMSVLGSNQFATVTATTAGTGNGSTTGNSVAFSSTISGAIAPGPNGSPAGVLTGGQNADTVTIGNSTYTFVAPGTATVANEVAEVTNQGSLKANIAATLANLENAVNNPTSGSGYNSFGAGTSAGGTATITALTNITGTNGYTATVTAANAGAGNGSTTGNWVNLAVSSTDNMMQATAMSGGTNADTVTIGNVTYTFVAAGTQMTSGNQVAVGTANANGTAIQNTLNNLKAAVNAQTASSGTTSNYFVTNLQGTTGGTMALSNTANNVANISALTSADIGLNAVFGAGDATGALSGLTTPTLAGGAAASGTTAATYASGMIDLVGGQPVIGNAESTLTATANISVGDSVVVNDQTYHFTASGANGANDVYVGATLQQSFQNLQDAINGGGTGGVNYSNGGNMTKPTGMVLSSFTTSGNTGTATFAATTIGAGGNNLALTYTNASGTPITSSGATAGGSANPDVITIGSQAYTFVAANAAVANNEVALGVASGTAGTPTYISAVQATLNNLEAAVNSTNVNNGSAATYHLGAGNIQNSGTGAYITSVNGSQAVVTSNLAGTGTSGAGTGNYTVLSYTSNAATSNIAGSAAAGQAAGTASGSFTLMANPQNGNTVTIGNDTYTFVTTAPTAAFQVAVGSNANATLTNLKAAVNGLAGAGTTYGANTAVNGLAQLGLITNNTAAIVSAITGTAANAVGLSSSISTGAAGGAVATPTMLSGGNDTTNAKATGVLSLASTPNQGDTVTIGSTTYTFVTGTPSGVNDVAIGVANGTTTSLQATMNNLMAAVNYGVGGNGAGSGVQYSGITQANNQVTITAANNGQADVQAVNGGSSGNKIALQIGSGQLLGGGGTSVDLSSATDAQNALTVIAGAISQVAATRGAIGSSINQMNAAVQVMNNTSQNLTSSLSGIQDANIGQVVANMSKYQVLEQTGIAALTQANQQEQAVLKLLQ